jgi:hypothetical protein
LRVRKHVAYISAAALCDTPVVLAAYPIRARGCKPVRKIFRAVAECATRNGFVAQIG